MTDPGMALTVCSTKEGGLVVSLKPAKYENDQISDAQKFDYAGLAGSIDFKHFHIEGENCEEVYLGVVNRQLVLVKAVVEFKMAEAQDIPESLKNQARKKENKGIVN